MQRPSTGLPQLGCITTLKGRDFPFPMRYRQPWISGVAGSPGFEVCDERFCCVRDQLGLVRGLQPVTDTPLLQGLCPASRLLNSLAQFSQSIPLDGQLVLMPRRDIAIPC